MALLGGNRTFEKWGFIEQSIGHWRHSPQRGSCDPNSQLPPGVVAAGRQENKAEGISLGRLERRVGFQNILGQSTFMERTICEPTA